MARACHQASSLPVCVVDNDMVTGDSLMATFLAGCRHFPLSEKIHRKRELASLTEREKERGGGSYRLMFNKMSLGS